MRYLPVEHVGNAQQSIEEAGAIADEIRRLLATGTFTDRDGTRRPLTPADILVVAPYNMHVRCLLQALPAGVEVGTVDKFQGREAPVVFFSMASSSGDEIPRGLEFLFSRNRLNVGDLTGQSDGGARVQPAPAGGAVQNGGADAAREWSLRAG